MNPPNIHYFPALDGTPIEALLASRRTDCPPFHSATLVATSRDRG